ncbi:MAG: acyl-CoA carboxylase subunit beta [Anaerolineae bacterium]|nr:acyl-CoA carboxylase subunit beta [Anaerolineae bacterium]
MSGGCVSQDSAEDPRLAALRAKQAKARMGGGADRIDRQHAKGKMTARERLDALLDPASFHELQPFAVAHPEDEDAIVGDGVVTGYGTIDGRRVGVYAQDFTVYGGSVSLAHARKIVQVQELAMNNGFPVIGLLDSGGARIQEGILSLQGYGEVFRQNALSSGVVPQISVIMGPCAGGASYSPALTDFVVMTDRSSMMFITGPDVVKSVTGEEIDHEGLGGARVHAGTSGVAHFVGHDETESLQLVRRLLSYLPANNVEPPPALQPEDDPLRAAPHLDQLVPEAPNIPYDMYEVIAAVTDRGSWFEVQANWAQNAIVGFARLDGEVVGIVAQQPMVLAGAIDIDASDKISRFVRFCDAFNIPLVTFVDSPGFLPGVMQEHGGIIRHGAKIIYAYVEATVPKLSVVTRKGYGGAYIVMGSRSLGADVHLAWPTAEMAVMGPEGAVNVLNRRELAAAEDPEARRAELVAEYRATYANPYYAARRGIVDNVIEPSQTRPELIAALRTVREQIRPVPPKKHGVMPA